MLNAVFIITIASEGPECTRWPLLRELSCQGIQDSRVASIPSYDLEFFPFCFFGRMLHCYRRHSNPTHFKQWNVVLSHAMEKVSCTHS